MAKRSDFVRRERDAYFTPLKAVAPLIPHLPAGRFTFAEPCAGDGRLVAHIQNLTQDRGQWRFMSDIEPAGPGIDTLSAFDITEQHVAGSDLIITNPPWDRKLLHPMITHLSALRPTWLLFDADWAFTKQSANFMPLCHKMIAIGRVKWIEDSKSVGKDNATWYFFDKNRCAATEFYGRKEAA